MIRLFVKGDLKQSFTVTRQIVPARRAINKVIVLPAKSITGLSVEGWEHKGAGFTPANGGTYLVDTRSAEIPIMLPATPPDRFQFHIRDYANNFVVNAAVLVRSGAQKLLMENADELAIDFNDGTVTVVYDAAENNWGV